MHIYKNNYVDYYKKCERKKLFKYYYQNILLNIPTLIKIIGVKNNSNFLKFSISESLVKIKELDVQVLSQNKTTKIYELKLSFMNLI
jgi:hypothetical protein